MTIQLESKQVYTILKVTYSHCSSLCVFLRQHNDDSSQPNSCQQLQHLCCKIIVATKGKNQQHLRNHLSKYSSVVSALDLQIGTVKLQHILQALAPNRLDIDVLFKRCSVFFPLNDSSLLQIAGPPIYDETLNILVIPDHLKAKTSRLKPTLLPNVSQKDQAPSTSQSPANLGFVLSANQVDPCTKIIDSAGIAGPACSVSDKKETAMSNLCSEEDSSSASVSQPASFDHNLSITSRHYSSLELFSSGSTTASNSVVVVSGESTTRGKQEGMKLSLATTERRVEPRESSLSAFLFNQTRNLNKSRSGVQDSLITCNSLFFPQSQSNEKQSVVMDTNALVQEPAESFISTTSESSGGELSGCSSDECEDLLSNQAYQYRKRKLKDCTNDRPCFGQMGSQRKKVPKRQLDASGVIKRKRNRKRNKKCARNRNKKVKSTCKKRAPVTTTLFKRTKILYAPNLKGVFPSGYVLNKYSSTISEARKLTALIFKSSVPSRASVLVHHRHPGKQLKLSYRLTTAESLLTKLLSNHRYRVAYSHLLQHHCPLPGNIILNSTEDIFPSTDLYGIRNEGGKGNEEDQTLQLSNLVNEFIIHDKVFSFIRGVLLKLVPPEFWGSVHNRAVFFTHLRRFVELRRWETLSVRQMCHGIKLSHCTWLKLASLKHRGRPHPPEAHLFEKFIRWLVEKVIIKTLSTFFYVTEHSEHNNRLFYYRKEVWSCIEHQAIQTVIPYKKISVEEVRKHFHFGQTLGISKIRLLPKSNGVRVIVNFGSRLKFSDQFQLLHPVNEQLKSVFHILNYEKNSRPQMIGSSCFGLNDVFTKLKKFSEGQKSSNPETDRPLLFVRVDISSCYDSMLADKVFEIISRKILFQRSYLIRRYAKVFLSQNKIRRTFLKAAAPKHNCPTFFKFAKKEAKTSSNCIFVDQGHHIEISKEKVELLLRKHLHGNIVKLGRDYYKQVRGIAHGAQLSTLLCGFYYADMERTCLPKIDPDKGLLMRYVDDFILITRERGVARQFLDTMQRGVAEYNCTINPAKTETNFRVREDGELECLEDVEWISWCGVLLNTKTLDVRTDFSKYTEKNIHDNMTISLHGKHFSYLRSFSRRVVKLRCLPIFLDARVVSDKNMMINMYQGFLIASYKYLTVLLSMPNAKKMAYPKQRGGFTRRELLFFFKTAVQMFTYFWHLTKNKGIRNPLLGKDLCVWLGCHSLREVLTQHQPNKLVFLIRLLSYKIYALSNILGVDMVRMFFSATKWHRSKSIFTVTV